jgi:predicted NUDIX family NTP pyrophosphohydrolase
MQKKSAGILMYRFSNGKLQVLLVHPGGPFWAKKDVGAWSIPKGEFESDEEPLNAAIREVREETGIEVYGDFIELTPVKQKSGKLIFAWAIAWDVDVNAIQSNFFEMEWPPKSGKMKSFVEVDKAAWFDTNQASEKIIPGQLPLLKGLQIFLNQ